MDLVCLDMEGVLTPEIWIEFARVSGIEELRRTTREEPDYQKLMAWRIGLLRERGLGLKAIQAVIEQIDPLPGAKAFLDALRDHAQVVILSDTFEEFAKPLLDKLGRPTIFCNSLSVDADGFLTGINMRVKDSKLATVRALQSVGFTTIAVGDSYNDLDMLINSKKGFLFRTTERIKADYPRLPSFTEYGDLLDAVIASLG